jgi:hypothetical protein
MFRYLNKLLVYWATKFEGLTNEVIMLQFKNVKNINEKIGEEYFIVGQTLLLRSALAGGGC